MHGKRIIAGIVATVSVLWGLIRLAEHLQFFYSTLEFIKGIPIVGPALSLPGYVYLLIALVLFLVWLKWDAIDKLFDRETTEANSRFGTWLNTLSRIEKTLGTAVLVLLVAVVGLAIFVARMFSETQTKVENITAKPTPTVQRASKLKRNLGGSTPIPTATPLIVNHTVYLTAPPPIFTEPPSRGPQTPLLKHAGPTPPMVSSFLPSPAVTAAAKTSSQNQSGGITADTINGGVSQNTTSGQAPSRYSKDLLNFLVFGEQLYQELKSALLDDKQVDQIVGQVGVWENNTCSFMNANMNPTACMRFETTNGSAMIWTWPSGGTGTNHERSNLLNTVHELNANLEAIANTTLYDNK